MIAFPARTNSRGFRLLYLKPVPEDCKFILCHSQLKYPSSARTAAIESRRSIRQYASDP